MQRCIAIVFLLAFCAVSVVAQTDGTVTSYFIGMGGGFTRTNSPMAQAWMVGGMCFEKTQTCPFTEFNNVTGKTTTMQGGIMQKLAKAGDLKLGALFQVGGARTALPTDPADTTAQVNSSFTAVFSGGFVMTYVPKKWKGLGITVPIKAVKINGTDVQMTLGAGVVMNFWP